MFAAAHAPAGGIVKAIIQSRLKILVLLVIACFVGGMAPLYSQ